MSPSAKSHFWTQLMIHRADRSCLLDHLSPVDRESRCGHVANDVKHRQKLTPLFYNTGRRSGKVPAYARVTSLYMYMSHQARSIPICQKFASSLTQSFQIFKSRSSLAGDGCSLTMRASKDAVKIEGDDQPELTNETIHPSLPMPRATAS